MAKKSNSKCIYVLHVTALWMILTALILFLYGCDKKDFINLDINDVDNVSLTQNWIGSYEYVESWENESNDIVYGITYNIDIYSQEDGVFARFQACGAQTYIDVLTRVEGDEDKIVLYVIEDNISSHPSVEMDNILLTLYMENDSIKTSWGSIISAIENINGDYFYRLY